MNTASKQTNDETQIRRLIEERINAVRTKNVDGAVANISPDLVMFDVVDPLQSQGTAASRERAEAWFGSFDGPLDFEIAELQIAVGDEAAFAHGLSHVSATKTGGGKLDMWWRVTLGFRKLDGRWITTHEHNSVPFDMETGKASLDLKP